MSELLRFPSSRSGEGLATLKEYAGRMKPGQKDIYYIAADSLAAAANAPFVEQLIKRDLEARAPYPTLPSQPPVQRAHAPRFAWRAARETGAGAVRADVWYRLRSRRVAAMASSSSSERLRPPASRPPARVRALTAEVRAQVLYLTEPIDEPAISAIADYAEHKFVDVTREGLELAGDEGDGKKKARSPPICGRWRGWHQA